MGGILDEHVEWAIVNRLGAMLEAPPNTKFNVTQSFALFSSVLLWTKNRAWVGGNRVDESVLLSDADKAAAEARKLLSESLICDAPWLLSRRAPTFRSTKRPEELGLTREEINAEFGTVTAETFFKWLRDALAHGDGRTIRPIHKPSHRSSRTLLAGFRIEMRVRKGSDPLLLSLYRPTSGVSVQISPIISVAQ
jgi:hypothetical protein